VCVGQEAEEAKFADTAKRNPVIRYILQPFLGYGLVDVPS